MSLENTAIEDRLHDAGYKTERVGDVVNVFDPIHSVVGKDAVITGWTLREVRDMRQALAFIEAGN
jgi:hypothetical protein